MLSGLKDLMDNLNELILGKEKKDRRMNEEVIKEEVEEYEQKDGTN